MINKLGFSGEYVENISPAERVVYIKYHLKQQEENKMGNKGGKPNSIPIT